MKTKYDLGETVWFFIKTTGEITHSIIVDIHAYIEAKHFADNGKLLASKNVLIYKVGGLTFYENQLFATKEECAKYYAEYCRKLFEEELC